MNTETRLAFGARVRKLRMEQGLSLRKFASMIGISKDYLVDLEYGRKSPTLDTLVKISGGFDISLSELLENVDSNRNAAQDPLIRHRARQETPTKQTCDQLTRPTSRIQPC